MTNSEISIKVLEAADGKTLTNGEVYSRKVYLGRNDSVEKWREIPESEVPREEDLGDERIS